MATEADNPDAHNGTLVRAYLLIFLALAIFTLVSFIANYAAHEEQKWISTQTAFTIILGVAIIKAILVAMFFMHLKFDWGRVYFMIVPVLILGVMMMMVLLPDIVLARFARNVRQQPSSNVTPAP
jgi:caa(3)-type oxidase subunit IV